jgi:hypothetical protein
MQFNWSLTGLFFAISKINFDKKRQKFLKFKLMNTIIFFAFYLSSILTILMLKLKITEKFIIVIKSKGRIYVFIQERR